MELNGITDRYATAIPNNMNILSLAHFQLLIKKLNKMAYQVPLDEPFKAVKAKEWDAMTTQNWVDTNLFDVKVKKVFEIAIRAIFGTEPNEISFLFMLWYIHQNTSFEMLVEVKGHAQDKKMMLGAGGLTSYLISKAQSFDNFELILNTSVKIINHNAQTVRLSLPNLSVIEADFLVTAMPPCSINRIAFHPLLPHEKRFAFERNFMGKIMKIIVLYSEDFWTKQGYCGESISDCVDSPVFNVFDDSRPIIGTDKIQPALVVFVNAIVLRTWETRSDLVSKTLEKLTHWYGNEAKNPIHIEIQNWTQEKDIFGGPTANFPPGTLSQLTKPLHHPVGRIFFAGTEFASISSGYINGAIQSGKRVSAQLNTQLNKLDKLGKQKFEIEMKKAYAESGVGLNQKETGFVSFAGFLGQHSKSKPKPWTLNSNFKFKSCDKSKPIIYNRYGNQKVQVNSKCFMFLLLICFMLAFVVKWYFNIKI